MTRAVTRPLLTAMLAALLACAVLLAGPMRTAAAATPVTAAQLDAYLTVKGSPMAGQGAAFVASGARWQLDPRLVVAIAGAESSFGKITCAPYNAWGYGCPDGPYDFSSWADGIDTVSRGLRSNYLAEGRTTVALIHLKYAPLGAANDPTGLNNSWTRNVSQFMIEMGGDPNSVDAGGVSSGAPLVPAPGAAPAEAYSFELQQASATRAAAKPLVVRAGEPRPLIVLVTNTGSEPWSTETVRLRRVDGDNRVLGAPFGALTTPGTIASGATARFVVQLAAAGSSGGAATTTWRLEGPAGTFGDPVTRPVRIAVPDFVAGDVSISATSSSR